MTDMAKVNRPNRPSRTSIHEYPFLAGALSDGSREAEDFQKEVAEKIAEMCRNEFAVDGSQDVDKVDLCYHRLREPDDSQPLTVEPPLSLPKICAELTAVEQLWLVRMVRAHGKKVVLARWPAYEAHINYVRCLR